MRLDQYLVEKGYFETRTKAKQSIERNEVFLDGRLITKPSFLVEKEYSIEIKQPLSFVSIGGYKLEKAISEFNLSVEDNVCVDIGASTGGFTDCLLKRNAKKVYAVDLNDTLLHQSLKQDDRVVPIIKNAKELKINDFSEKIDFICADLSFISATQIISVISSLAEKTTKIILLVKPQFEMDKRIKLKNGIIKDVKLREQAVKKISECAESYGLNKISVTETGYFKDKNTEYLVYLTKNE